MDPYNDSIYYWMLFGTVLNQYFRCLKLLFWILKIVLNHFKHPKNHLKPQRKHLKHYNSFDFKILKPKWILLNSTWTQPNCIFVWIECFILSILSYHHHWHSFILKTHPKHLLHKKQFDHANLKLWRRLHENLTELTWQFSCHVFT